MYNYILNIVFPPKCIFCCNVLEAQSDINICESCYKEIILQDIKSINYTNIFNAPFCDTVICPCVYEGNIKKALSDFKFRDRPSLYRALAYIVFLTLKEIISVEDVDIVVGVPLSPKRFKTRGYNQAGLLAKYLAKRLNVVNASSAIIRTRDTDKQSSLDRNNRSINVLNAFEVIDIDYIKDKKVLIVDDIFTTGSTISECAKVLKNAGAAKVHAAVVASGRFF